MAAALQGKCEFLSTLSLRRATWMAQWRTAFKIFLSTLSLRRATQQQQDPPDPDDISIHALLAESDHATQAAAVTAKISIHALLAESDGVFFPLEKTSQKFLSTLSLRRATIDTIRIAGHKIYFYPRSPCGERRESTHQRRNRTDISIHALLAESDDTWARGSRVTYVISIHALLAESDLWAACGRAGGRTFLSTLSLRRATHDNADDKSQ